MVLTSCLEYSACLLVFLLCALGVFALHNVLLVFSNRVYSQLVHTINGPYDFNFKRFGDNAKDTNMILESEVPVYLRQSNFRFKVDRFRRGFDRESFEKGVEEFPELSADESSMLCHSMRIFSSAGGLE